MPSPFSQKRYRKEKSVLIHDLQTFLWQFEQGGYSKEAMKSILAKFGALLTKDSQQMNEKICRHVQKMLADCRSYAEGEGSSLSIVKDLEALKSDLE